MKPFSFAVLGAALGFALLVTGCESDSASARIQEKSATYATLKPWQKKYIERGDIATGFTPDMVYMAVGPASQVKRDPAAAAGNDETWIYGIFYLPPNSTHYRPPTEKAVATSYEAASTSAGGSAQANSTSGNARGGGTAVTGSMEPADMQSYKLTVSFHDGKVVKYGITKN